ncbi:TetR/AcrR family transcriptional regulator [Bradyrhizobium sp. RDM4]|uniref:TetR/AcrR family transcriptional regulator n=1 Tax=Bradyrhizobium sp. RDM4 TaxID=3378765 RepID=UPI0038FCF315
MKVSKAQAAENRASIVEVASRQMRRGGFGAMTVGEVAKAAGLTHGALYSHFPSKEALSSEALAESVRQCHSDFSKLSLDDLLGHYLSVQHRDYPESGCPMAALVSQISQQDEAIQEEFANGFDGFVGLVKSGLKAEGRSSIESRELSIFAVAAMVGALAISRALQETKPAASETVLGVVRRQLARLFAPAA